MLNKLPNSKPLKSDSYPCPGRNGTQNEPDPARRPGARTVLLPDQRDPAAVRGRPDHHRRYRD